MTRATSQCALLVAALFAASPLLGVTAHAQEAAKREIKKDNPLPPSGSAGGQNHSDQNAKQESSSKVTGTNPTPEVFVNGSLTAPGAPADVDTTPAKFSARTAADDKLPIAAYRLKYLTDEQHKIVREAIGGAASTGSGSRALDGFATVGAEVPTAAALGDLKPIPQAVIAQLPALDGTVYTMSEGKLLLVNATTRVVVGVLE
jgi:hypothetical protein